ncbi:MAG TPA: WG repeat-containing protein [Pyrinomonadaceae bacterium]|nr:WG repeat-containing protein [Pyrinomonadaceae bacterium]
MVSANFQFSMVTKYSYIDSTGKNVIDASGYESAGNFSERLAAVLDRRKGWGFIDKTGAFVIPPKFESALGFSEGLAAVLLDNKWGFINKNGILVIDHQFDWVAEFSEGVAVVQRSLTPPKSNAPPPTESHKTGVSVITEVWNLLDDDNLKPGHEHTEFMIIDAAGQILAVLDRTKVEVNIDYATFSEGLLCAYSPEKDAMGYVNKSGDFVIEPKFAEASPFSEGLARVAVLENGMEKLAFINHKGDFVIPPGFNTDFDFRRNSSGFSEGLAAISEGLNPSRTKEARFIYIDKSGKIVLATEFSYAGEFRDGLAVVYSDRTNRWGFIGKTGKVVIPLQYQLANDFSDGLALVGR